MSHAASKIFATQCLFTDHLKLKTINKATFITSSAQNIPVDWESHLSKDSNIWKLCSPICIKMCEILGQPWLDNFDNRRSLKMLETYVTLWVSTICPNWEGLTENTGRQDRNE